MKAGEAPRASWERQEGLYMEPGVSKIFESVVEVTMAFLVHRFSLLIDPALTVKQIIHDLIWYHTRFGLEPLIHFTMCLHPQQ